MFVKQPLASPGLLIIDCMVFKTVTKLLTNKHDQQKPEPSVTIPLKKVNEVEDMRGDLL